MDESSIPCTMIGGELISFKYLDSLVVEISEITQHLGCISLASLAVHFELPLDLVTHLVTRNGNQNTGGIKHAILKVYITFQFISNMKSNHSYIHIDLVACIAIFASLHGKESKQTTRLLYGCYETYPFGASRKLAG